MSLTKENLLKQFDEFIDNEYYGMVDYSISNFPSIDKEGNVRKMREKNRRIAEI